MSPKPSTIKIPGDSEPRPTKQATRIRFIDGSVLYVQASSLIDYDEHLRQATDFYGRRVEIPLTNVSAMTKGVTLQWSTAAKCWEETPEPDGGPPPTPDDWEVAKRRHVDSERKGLFGR